MKQIKLLSFKLILPFFFIISSLSAAPYYLWGMKITGDGLRIIAKQNYTHLYGLFKTTDGMIYKMVIYAKGDTGEPEDITASFTPVAPVTAFTFDATYPPIFGNIEWKIDIPKKVQNSGATEYSIIAEDPKYNDGNIYYYWVNPATAKASSSLSGNFNPIPPRVGDAVKYTVEQLKVRAAALEKP